MVTSVFPGLVRNTFYCPTYPGEIEANLLAAKPKGQPALIIIFSYDQSILLAKPITWSW